MLAQHASPVVITIKEKCRVCYTCVRDCPAKAIRISGGQAEVITDRCIGCGNCVKVCSQDAKQISSSFPLLESLLERHTRNVVAIVAPSFPAEYEDLTGSEFCGSLKALGFDLVCQVAAGADLVAQEYARLLEAQPDQRWIASSCPAIVSYVEKYHPAIAESLAPIVSPMVATARMVRAEYGKDLDIVFIGPCPAKKLEAIREDVSGDVDVVLTFQELNQLLVKQETNSNSKPIADFDPPQPVLGGLFPIARGLVQTAGLKADLLKGNVVSAEGKNDFAQALREFEAGSLDTNLLDILCCKGCIMGAGMTSEAPSFRRQAKISAFVNQQVQQGKSLQDLPQDIPLAVSFCTNDNRLPLPSKAEIEEILQGMGKFQPVDELDCGACGYATCRDHAVAIHKGLAETEMCLPYTIDRLKESLEELNESNHLLADTKAALVNAEKLASMGQLSAGIAHEINNPLGVILLYSQLMLEDADSDSRFAKDIQTIVDQAERCKGIVSGLLNFARKNKVVRIATNLENLIHQCLKVTRIPENIRVHFQTEMHEPVADLDADQIIQVLTNLLNNAIEAMPSGGSLVIKTVDENGQVGFEFTDSGVGIKKNDMKKIFEPFFTTKEMGKGTGLGLAVIYGIIKMHQGSIVVESNDDPASGPTGTTFKVTLPRRME